MRKEISDARPLIWSMLLAIVVVAATGVRGRLLYSTKSVIHDFVGGATADWAITPVMACTAITSNSALAWQESGVTPYNV